MFFFFICLISLLSLCFLDTTYDNEDKGTTTYNEKDGREGQDDEDNSSGDVVEVSWALVCFFLYLFYFIPNTRFLDTSLVPPTTVTATTCYPGCTH
jgi:hypothetical protein